MRTSPPEHPFTPNAALLRLGLVIGVVGFVASVAAHIASIAGVGLGEGVFVLHIGIFAALLPVVGALRGLTAGADDSQAQVRRFMRALWSLLPTWQKAMAATVLAYAVVNFAVGFAGLISTGRDMDGPAEVRLFSGHWMAFYLGIAVLTSTLLRDARLTATE